MGCKKRRSRSSSVRLVSRRIEFGRWSAGAKSWRAEALLRVFFSSPWSKTTSSGLRRMSLARAPKNNTRGACAPHAGLFPAPAAAEGFGEGGEGDALVGFELAEDELDSEDVALGIDDFKIAGQTFVVAFLGEPPGLL